MKEISVVTYLALFLSSFAVAEEEVLFSFDDQSIPWHDNLKVTLLQGEKHPGNPVLRRGPEGAPDHGHTFLYGSVLWIDGKFRMWYLGMSQKKLEGIQAPGYWRPMCYAESDDGIIWTKPDLGLHEFKGSKKNNICLIKSKEPFLERINDFLTVIYDPEDPDPNRRYKCAYIASLKEGERKGGMNDVGFGDRFKNANLAAMVTAVSADGLTWNVNCDRPPVDGNFEVSGIYRFGNFYYATGQVLSPWAWLPDGSTCGRLTMAYRSSDFDHWSKARALSFARPEQRTAKPTATEVEKHKLMTAFLAKWGAQTHVGAGYWNRGNVLVGFYGMWQDGPVEGKVYDGTRIDLGLVLSNDGIHFREPVPNFKMLARGEEGRDWDSFALLQGHAFANVGDKTYVWYSHWDIEGEFRNQDIGLATWRRDGFGYLSRQHQNLPGHFVTKTFLIEDSDFSIAINVEAVSEKEPITVEMLDDFDRPVKGASGPDAAVIKQSGTQQKIVWSKLEKGQLKRGSKIALRVHFPAASSAKVYAVYVTH